MRVGVRCPGTEAQSVRMLLIKNIKLSSDHSGWPTNFKLLCSSGFTCQEVHFYTSRVHIKRTNKQEPAKFYQPDTLEKSS